jgi:choline dehydrogenase
MNFVGNRSSDKTSFDYIVVGAGSAGCVLASRLSENPQNRVLLVEPGKDRTNIFVNCPGAFIDNQLTAWDWQFKTEPQKHMNNRLSLWPRGKGLGGSHLINALMHIRGCPENFNSWASKHGCKGWDYESVLPFFKKSETFRYSLGGKFDVEAQVDKDVHGFDGPLVVADPGRGTLGVWAERFVQASMESGIKYNPDLNGRVQEGVGIVPCTVNDGVRDSTAQAYLKRSGALKRANLTLMLNSCVEKLNIDDSKTVTGVFVRTGGKLIPFTAEKEVLLCAGALQTPAILMSSGIGPKDHLDSLGIPVIQDLPVGKNLHDHLMIPLTYESLDRENTLDDIAVPNSLTQLLHVLKFVFTHKGVVTSTGMETSIFYNTHLDKDLNENDVQMLFAPFSPSRHIRTKFGLENEMNEELPKYGVTFLPTVIQPKSRGEVRLRSKDCLDIIIDPHYLEETYDTDVLVKGLKLAREISKASSLQGHIGKEAIDPTNPHDPESDDYLKEYIRRYALTIYHPVGTAKMGDVGDPSTVVDTNLKVKGIENLRVVDASVMPVIVSGNTNACVVMIAEKASYIIMNRP